MVFASILKRENIPTLMVIVSLLAYLFPEKQLPYAQATGIEIGLLIAGIALSAAAGLLLKPKGSRNPLTRNNTAPTLAERGSFIPYVIGTARVGAVVCWVGKPKTKTKSSGGVLGFNSTKTKIKTQAAWHCLCVGPGDALLAIYESGKKIFPTGSENALYASTTPSGTKKTLKSKAGSFRIFWGEPDQPVSALLSGASGVGAASRWPHVMYVLWDTKVLTTPNQWPQLDYVVRVRPHETILTGTDKWMPGTDTLNNPVNQGANPIHAMMQILTDTFPHGLGLDPATINRDCAEATAELLEGEGQCCNIVVENGDDALNAVSDIMSDCGVVMPQMRNEIDIHAIRSVPDVDVPEIPDKALLSPLPEKEFIHGEKQADRLNFVFKDRKLNFRDNDITIDDDSAGTGRPKLRKIELNTVIDNDIANIVVSRRQQEEFASLRAYKVNVSRGARELSIGKVFKNASLGQLRIVSVEKNTDTPKAVLECVSDVYSQGAISFQLPPSNPPENNGVPVRDTVYDFFELPPPYKDQGLSIAPLRLRANDEQEGALVDLSADGGVNFVNVDAVEDLMFSGLLNAALSATADPLQMTGPLITVANETDNDLFNDLSAESLRWRTGEQIAIIDNEICFFSVLTAISAGVYRLDGLIRGRKGTTQAAHLINSRVWLMPANQLHRIENSLILVGSNLTMRALTVVGADILDEAAATPYATRLITGKTLAPYPPSNFRTDDLNQTPFNTWAPGGPVNLIWSNHQRTEGATAGTQGAGVAMSTSITMDGQLLLTIRKMDNTLVRQIVVASGVAYTYLNATLVADFAGEPTQFKIDYQQFEGSYSSAIQTITVTRR